MKLKPTQPVIDLKEPIRSTDFVSLESIKNDRKTIGLKSVDDSQRMPRADQQGTLQKVMAEAAKQESQLTSSDWQWLREVYRQAVLIDEMNRRGARRLEVAQADITNITAMNLAATKEQRSARQEQITRAHLEWREWIDKIVRQSRAHKRDIFEIFVKSLVDKFHFLKILKHREDLGILNGSKTKLAIQHQAETQRLHAHDQSRFHKLKVDQIWVKNDFDINTLNEARITRLHDLRDLRKFTNDKIRQETLFHLMKSMGMRPDLSLLPINQRQADENNEKIARMKLEIEHNRRVDLHQFRAELAALQSSALSLDHKETFLKKVKRLESGTNSNDEAKPQPVGNEKEKTMAVKNKVPDLSSTQRTVHDLKVMNAEEQTPSESTTNPSDPSSPAIERPPQKPKLFKPAFPSIARNAVDLKEQNDSLDRMALDKKKEQMENIEAVNLQMSQLQAASQLLQSSLSITELNKSGPVKDVPALDVRQKIKAAK
jgi:hypothetical protein